MTGRVVLVTGANSGLGYEVSRYLCEGGNDVIMACRNEERGENAVKKIRTENPSALATFMKLDLGSKESIQAFAEAFHATGKKLNVLINNAGLSHDFKSTNRHFTSDGFEETMGTNHFGHFLLTNLLLDDLKSSAGDTGESKIVVVASSAHDPETTKKMRMRADALDIDDLLLHKEGAYTGFIAYKNSKIANIMFTYELARQLEDSKVTVNCVCPGFIPSTGLSRSASKATQFFTKYVLGGALRFTKITRTVKQGALDIANLATLEKYKGIGGKYFKNGVEAESSAETKDVDVQKKLWQATGGYLQMEGYDVIELPPPEPESKPEEEKKEEEKKEGETSKTVEEVKKEETKEEEKKEETKEEKKEEDKGKEEEKKDEEKATEETKEEKVSEKKE